MVKLRGVAAALGLLLAGGAAVTTATNYVRFSRYENEARHLLSDVEQYCVASENDSDTAFLCDTGKEKLRREIGLYRKAKFNPINSIY